MTGYEKLTETVKRDCSEGDNCFNENGCDKEQSHCFHKYCNKFKWIIDRAKHYEARLGIPWMEILNSWEEDRNYWYMNYYQDSNQPLIESDNVFVFESAEEMHEKVGNKFICPHCQEISTDPYECNSGKEVDGKVCDWTSYGFLQFNLAFIYCKKERKGTKCFMPVAFTKVAKQEDKQCQD